MASLKGSAEIIEILHTCVQQDSTRDYGVLEHILRIILDVNNPTGAFVFVCAVGGLFVIFIAILDSLKPPNFPPGPRWLPFGGDSSAVCEKLMTKTTAAKLLKQFGPVVGLRRKNGHRNPVVLVLDDVSAEAVKHAASNGFLEFRSFECSEFNISEFTGISRAFRRQIDLVLLSEDTMNLIKNSACDSTRDLFDVLNDSPQQELNSSIISKTVLAAILNVVLGRRVKPNSTFITRLHQILINKSVLNHIFSDNQRTENFHNTSCAAQYYSKLIMVLSDLDEDKDFTSLKSSSRNVFNFLAKNYDLLSLPEKLSVVADILICVNIGSCFAAMDEILNTLNCRRLQVPSSTGNSFEPSSKEACFKQCKSLIFNLSKKLPLLNIGRRWEVVKSFYINGFTVPQGSSVQTVLLSHEDSHATSVSDERIPYEEFTMSVLSLVLREIVFYCKSG